MPEYHSEMRLPLSSSLWGCELKYDFFGLSHSWNAVILLVRMWVEMPLLLQVHVHLQRHPPCEDVSWNMIFLACPIPGMPSSSLWGCELKFFIRHVLTCFQCHPPCEDVSWNTLSISTSCWFCVILLVRMWVEICFLPFSNEALYRHPPCEDVSWNLRIFPVSSLHEVVILLVRMWVEMMKNILSLDCSWSSSLWGCELKL